LRRLWRGIVPFVVGVSLAPLDVAPVVDDPLADDAGAATAR
jgi:hypothetical protein